MVGNSDAGSALVDGRSYASDAGNALVCGFTMPNPVSTGLPNPAAYDTSLEGIAVDQVTGLMWERQVNGHAGSSGCTADQRGGLLCPLRYATAYCTNNRLGGFSDWHLPTQIELISLIDSTMQYPSVDQTAFSDTPSEPFWSSTRVGDENLGDAWYVSFVFGTQTYAFIDEAHRVRCVRTDSTSPARCYTPGSRFQVADSLVSDKATGLVWQQDGAPSNHTFADAQTYCASLGDGFRLPSVKETLTIVDFTKAPDTGMIDRTVFAIPRGFYWTSSIDVRDPASAWTISFEDGSIVSTDFFNSIGQTKCLR